MTRVSLGLSYWLPKTEIGITLTRRVIVETRDDGTSWPKIVADVVVTPKAVEDTSARQTLTIEERTLANLDLSVGLDDRGFITSINSETSRDITPVLDILGKTVGLAAQVLGVAEQEPKFLDAEWALRNPKLNDLLISLSTRVSSFLTLMVSEETGPERIKVIADALDVLQSQLASISEARRAWIVAQATTQATTTLALNPSDLVIVEGQRLPDHLPENRTWTPGGQNVSRDYGVIVAIAEQTTDADTPSGPAANTTNTIALRRPRKATLGVYLLRDGTTWTLDPTSVSQVDIVDERCATDFLSLDGHWLHGEKFQLAYHPDMSLKTFGFTSTSTSTAAGLAASTGGLLDAASGAVKSITSRPTAAQQQLDAAKLQLDLLQNRSEFEMLSATRGKAAELATLQQNVAIASLSK